MKTLTDALAVALSTDLGVDPQLGLRLIGSLLLNAGAELRPLGRIAWLHVKTGEPWKSPQHCAPFVLRPAI